uniref:Cytochrome P450 n=1 Tax=Parastrongyloides trichosuri TaxID=131310 RepID=A0A0N4ZZZ6_PARTI
MIVGIIVLSIIILLLSLYFLRNINDILIWYNERKRRIELAEKIPGPKGYPIFGNANLFLGERHKSIENITKIVQAVMKEGKPFIRFWIGETLEIHPLTTEACKAIYDSSIEINKSKDYEIITPWLGYGLLTSNGKKWKERRRLLTPTFHFNMLKKYFATYNNESKNMVNYLKKYAVSGEEIDVFMFAKRITLDIICEAAMGVKVNALENHNNEYLNAVNRYSKLLIQVVNNPLNKITPYYYLFGHGYEIDRTVELMKGFTQNIIKKKTEEFEQNGFKTSDNTFLSNLLQLKNENKWNEEDLREEVETFMFAGHDTTASLNAFLWFSIACHEEVQNKLYDEIIDVLGDEDRAVMSEDINKLKYMDMVVKETLRRHPIIPFIARDLTCEMDICGYTLPKGINFTISAQYLNFNPNIYPDPYKFDPERFLPENVAKRHAYDFTPFSAGPRNCIGQRFAMNEIIVTLSWLIRRYKLSSKKSFDYVKHTPLVVQSPNKDIPVIFTLR